MIDESALQNAGWGPPSIRPEDGERDSRPPFEVDVPDLAEPESDDDGGDEV